MPVEADAAGVHVETVKHLGQRLVEPEHDLNLPVWELRDHGDSPKGPNRVDLDILSVLFMPQQFGVT